MSFEDRAVHFLGDALAAVFGSANEKRLRAMEPGVARVCALEPEAARLSDAALAGKTAEFRERLADGETLEDLLPEAFACVREAAKRTLGMRHYDVQILGGIVLHRGMIAEMITGEGKTLVATLAVYLNALEGQGVHVVTVNDYLARRDAAWMGPIYRALGMTVGAIQAPMGSSERQPVYACDVTYGTNNEFGFDYLRDNMKLSAESQVQKRRHYAIVDEVDSILIDEARTPLIISGSAQESADLYYKADRLVARLKGTSRLELDPVADRLRRQQHLETEAAMVEAEKDCDYVYSEKEHSAHLTELGMERAAGILGLDDFYSGGNMHWPHYLENALKARSLYKKDVAYVVKDGEVLIVDEFTGRMMHGRRWSDGLHQAVEAKEGLKIREETQTLATITLQNFFRLYDKLAGMTGTAMTEAREFKRVYKIDVVSVPPNRPLRRTSHPDMIYGSEKEKYDAIAEEVARHHDAGRPVLVGTISIEKSEKLSLLLERRGIPHEVLNAKQHEREAYIVARAGELGAVTIATNMAGRGTDIVLGRFTDEELLEHWRGRGLAPKNLRPGLAASDQLIRHWAGHFLGREDADAAPVEELREALERAWAEEGRPPLLLTGRVAELGGLHIVGSERHEARRIDNQLRGRAGRQGDPGSSRFFLSLEDDLMRVFASDWVRRFMRRMGLSDGVPLESRLVSRQLEKAQLRVEEHNFAIRRRLIEYDEVMNVQRERIYGVRQDVLEEKGLREIAWGMIEDVIDRQTGARVDENQPAEAWDLAGLAAWTRRTFGVEFAPGALAAGSAEAVEERLRGAVRRVYDVKQEALGSEHMRALEKFVLLEVIDKKWKDHLAAMDDLRDAIGYRSYAQKDPKSEYKREGLELFMEMFQAVQDEVADLLLKVQFAEGIEQQVSDVWNIQQLTHEETAQFSARPAEDAYAAEHGGADAEEMQRVEQVRRTQPKVGRNAPCPCGSGRKYKKCCGRGG